MTSGPSSASPLEGLCFSLFREMAKATGAARREKTQWLLWLRNRRGFVLAVPAITRLAALPADSVTAMAESWRGSSGNGCQHQASAPLLKPSLTARAYAAELGRWSGP